MACVCNSELHSDIRCRAAQQLAALVRQPECLASMAVPTFLEACLRHIERAVGVISSDDHGSDAAEEPKPLSVFQMQLPVACMSLLSAMAMSSCGTLVRCRDRFVACWQCRTLPRLVATGLSHCSRLQTHAMLYVMCLVTKPCCVQAWLVDHGPTRLCELTPLIFHPLTMVRRAVCVFLAPIIFLPPCQLVDDTLPAHQQHHQSQKAARGQEEQLADACHIALYEPFIAAHHLPVPSVTLVLPALSSSSADAGALVGVADSGSIGRIRLLLSLQQLLTLAQQRAATAPGAPVHPQALFQELQQLLDHLPGEASGSLLLCKAARS